jgi:hypothetical protein
MLVIIDTNIWISELGLKSAKGAAAKFYLNQNKAKIILPEVVKLETEVNFAKNLQGYADDIAKNHRMLLAIFGKLKEIVLPTKEEIQEKAKSIFDQFGIEIIEIPFSLSSARNSFIKTIHKLSPSGTNQQFKDGVIWADALTLLNDDDVLLVSSDRAFYKNKKFEEGLDTELLHEAKAYPKTIRIFPSITDLIEDIKIEIKIDEKNLVSSYISANKDKLFSLLDLNGFELINEFSTKIDCYATLEPNDIFVNFEITYNLTELTDQERTNGKYILNGEASYNPTNKIFNNLNSYNKCITSVGGWH